MTLQSEQSTSLKGDESAWNIRMRNWFQIHTWMMVCTTLVAILCIGSIQALFLLQYGPNSTEYPIVDLGYSIYHGFRDDVLQLDYFNGIRYAAPPVGNLRWQKPQEPIKDRIRILPALDYSLKCPQSFQGPTPTSWFFFPSDQVSEDCLFLNVVSPANATDLPVFVWIHGGGYGLGDGRYNYTEILIKNSRSFVVVTIQYRLGAFGFLSSSELTNFGVPNVGLYDQHFALLWVQRHISKFGGDPRHVTIAGESAGAGSVMQQILAYGGTEGTKYFTNAIVASPYFPPQRYFNDEQPTKAYNAFIEQVGCSESSTNLTVFECLSLKDTYSLQNASAFVSTSVNYGQWAFIPVVDGHFIKEPPIYQLFAGKVNGLRILSGHNSDEGPAFVPQEIQSGPAFELYVQSLLPSLDKKLYDKIYALYAISETIPGPLFSTLGSSGPTALNQSTFAIGHQQRANNLYAESTFVCPSYWLADAFSFGGRISWKSQFSVPPAAHGTDLNSYYKPDSSFFSQGTLSAGFRTGIQLSWGRFILHGDPTLPQSVIDPLKPKYPELLEDLSAASNTSWLPWDTNVKKMINFNSSGGMEKKLSLWIAAGKAINITMNIEPGLMANWTISDAKTWEGGRARRCNFWASIKKKALL